MNKDVLLHENKKIYGHDIRAHYLHITHKLFSLMENFKIFFTGNNKYFTLWELEIFFYKQTNGYELV